MQLMGVEEGEDQIFALEALRYNSSLSSSDIFTVFKGQVIFSISLFPSDSFVEHFHYSLWYFFLLLLTLRGFLHVRQVIRI